MHWHHIVPRHAGGSDDPSNLVQLTIPEHAEAHHKLYEEYGRWEDRIAWQMLSGRVLPEEARLEAAKLGYQDWITNNPDLHQAKAKQHAAFLTEKYGKETTIGGVTYVSRGAAARALGITETQARREAQYVERGYPSQEGAPKRVKINEQLFASLKEAAVGLEMGYSTLRKHIRAGKITVQYI